MTSETSVVERARPSVPLVATLIEVHVPEAENGESPAERARIDEFLRSTTEEQERLRVEIRAARDRIDRATSVAASSGRDASNELAALVTDAHEELTRLEREHQETIEAIRDRALAEAARLIDEARRRAIDVRARADQLLVQPDNQPTLAFPGDDSTGASDG